MDSIDITPSKGFPHMYDFIGDKVTKGSPVVLVILTLIIIMYYIIFSYLGVSVAKSGLTEAPKSAGITFIEIVMWGMFIFLVLINGVQYFFNVDIKTSIKNLFSPVPEVDIAVTTPQEAPVPELKYEKQVFHIQDNIYGYNDARAVCKAYGARLANYGEIENAYKKGAEWCGFGWSDNQMALYPTQSESWKKLQKIKGHKHDCGRPGINGGFVSYKEAPFGVNCYGYKPKITSEERRIMDTDQHYPLTPEERLFNKRVKYYRKHLPGIIVSPFNYDTWSEI